MLQKKVIAIFIALMCPILLLSQQTINIPNMKSSVPPDPSIKIGTLSNGLKYYIKKNIQPEKRMQLFLVVSAGGVIEDDDQQGLAHFCEHIAFKGTKSFPKKRLIDFFELSGVRWGPDLNAFTSCDGTTYKISIPTDKSELVADGFQVLEEWAHLVSYNDDDINTERGVVTEEWRQGQGADTRCFQKNCKYIFYNSKYAKYISSNDTNTVRHCPTDALRRFYHDWYRPDLMAVVAVGDFDIQDIEQRIKDHFSGLENPKNERQKPIAEMPAHKENFVTITKDKELGSSNVTIYFKRHEKIDDSYAYFRQCIAERLFTRMLAERLNEYRNKPNSPFNNWVLVYDYMFYGKDSKCFRLYADTRGSGVEQCTNTLLTEVFRALQHGFTASELERVKENTLKDIENDYAERNKTESEKYAYELMQNFLQNTAIPNISTELELYKKWLPEMSLEEINGLATKLIHKENVVISISAPDSNNIPVPTENDISKMFNDISESQIPAYIDEVSDKPLFDKELKTGKILNETKHNDIGVTELVLQNGVKVFLKPTNFKNDEILLTAFSKGGTSVVSDEDFISANWASPIIRSAGIGNFDNIQLNKKLTGKIATVRSSIGDVSQNIEGSCSPKDLETMFQLIYLNFTEPRKDTTSFKLYIDRLKNYINIKQKDPDYAFYDTVTAIEYNYYLRNMPLTDDAISHINLDKAYNFYKECYSNAENFTFVIVGNFDNDSMKSILTKYLGNLPTQHIKNNFKDLGVYTPKGILEKNVYKGEADKSQVCLIFSGPFDWNLDNRYYFESMSDALNIRLTEVLRIDKGGVYDVFTENEPQIYPHSQYTFRITFGCDPKRVNELVNSTLNIIKQSQESVMEPINIDKVKETQKRERETDLKDNYHWLSLLRSYLFYNDNISVILEKDKRITELTALDIQKAAKTYLNLNNYIKIILYPESYAKGSIKK